MWLSTDDGGVPEVGAFCEWSGSFILFVCSKNSQVLTTFQNQIMAIFRVDLWL